MIKVRYFLFALLCFNLAAAEPAESPAFDGAAMKRMEGLLSIPSPSKQEHAFQEYWLKHVSPKADSQGKDEMGNVWVTFKSEDPNARDLLIDAHADEVGVQIAGVTDNGFLRVRPVGYPLDAAMLCNMYQFMGDKGPVKAFAGPSPAWWLMRNSNIAQNSEILFDVGAANPQEVVAMGLKIGHYGTPATRPEILRNNRLMAHGLDCRLNTFILMELADFLANNKKSLKYNVTLLSSVQEEIGLRGGMFYCNKHKPQLAIIIDTVIDTCQLADTRGINIKETDITELTMGKGPVIYSNNMIFDAQLTGQLKRAADKTNTPYQEDPVFPPGLANFAPVKANNGRACLIGPAIRCMHSPREMCDLKDAKGVLEIIKTFVTMEL